MDNRGNFWGGLIAGAAIGAALALLFAPAKGSETREELGNKLKQLYDELKQTKAKVASGDYKEDLNQKIDNLEKKIEQVISQMNTAQ